jgi:hypothetical protein
MAIRIVLAMERHCGSHIVHQMDMAKAFPNGWIDRYVYMEEFVELGKENLVYKLCKELYGLNKALRSWYTWIYGHLEEVKFKKSDLNPNPYAKITLMESYY